MELVGALIPMLIFGIIISAIFAPVAKRKGVSYVLLLWNFVPLGWIFFPICLASKTDKSILERLDRLENK